MINCIKQQTIVDTLLDNSSIRVFFHRPIIAMEGCPVTYINLLLQFAPSMSQASNVYERDKDIYCPGKMFT